MEAIDIEFDLAGLTPDLRSAVELALGSDEACQEAMSDETFARIPRDEQLRLISTAARTGDFNPLLEAIRQFEEVEFDGWVAEREVCPRCGGQGVHILWGLVTNEVEPLVERRTIVLGGCLVSEGSPDWECLSCRHQWGTMAVEIDD